MENVERGTPPTHQTAATAAFSCSAGVSWRPLGRILDDGCCCLFVVCCCLLLFVVVVVVVVGGGDC